MKKTVFTGYVYDSSADYNTVTLDDIKDKVFNEKKWYSVNENI